MPTIIDSLFLELGVDTSKFSADQQKALKKIAEFESSTKRAAGNARGQVATVGQAFRDLARDSRLGSSASQVENLATRFKALGVSLGAAGGAGEGLGAVAIGLGALLSPAAMGVATIALLTKGAWDLNRRMTEVNSTIDRQAQLSDMNAKSLWSWGEAAKTVGGNPQDVIGGIASVQKAIAGMMVGAGDATSQLVALSRLGMHWNPQNGLNDSQVTEMFTKAHQKAAALGYKNLGALRAQLDPIMNTAMQDLALDPEFDPSKLQKQIADSAPKNINAILQGSLKRQMSLGKLDIDKDILAETAYGGTEGLTEGIVTILREMLGFVKDIADAITSPKKIAPATVDAASRGMEWAINGIKNFFGRSSSTTNKSMALAMKTLMDGGGLSEKDAASLVGNAMQESAMDPLARNASGNVGLFQWNKARQANFAKWAGYPVGTGGVPADKQFTDQLMFAIQEPEYNAAVRAMAKAKDLLGKTRAFMDIDERPGDDSLGKRFGYAQQAENLAGMLQSTNYRYSSVQHNDNSSDVTIGDVHVHANTADPAGLANAFRKGIEDQPLLSPNAMGMVSLATRGTTP